MRFLLDTNIVSEVRKPKPIPAVVRWFDAQDADSLYLNVLTLGEIREGIERLRAKDASRAQALTVWLADLAEVYADRILLIDQAVAEEWGRLRAIRPVPAVDGLLAATARVHGLTLVSRNERDFKGLGVSVLNPV